MNLMGEAPAAEFLLGPRCSVNEKKIADLNPAFTTHAPFNPSSRLAVKVSRQLDC